MNNLSDSHLANKLHQLRVTFLALFADFFAAYFAYDLVMSESQNEILKYSSLISLPANTLTDLVQTAYLGTVGVSGLFHLVIHLFFLKNKNWAYRYLKFYTTLAALTSLFSSMSDHTKIFILPCLLYFVSTYLLWFKLKPLKNV